MSLHPDIKDRPGLPPCQCLPHTEQRLAELIRQLIAEGQRHEADPSNPFNRSRRML